jgi:hypothetical protein
VSLCPQDIFCPSAGTGRYRRMPVCRAGLACRPSSNRCAIPASWRRGLEKIAASLEVNYALIRARFSRVGIGRRPPRTDWRDLFYARISAIYPTDLSESPPIGVFTNAVLYRPRDAVTPRISQMQSCKNPFHTNYTVDPRDSNKYHFVCPCVKKLFKCEIIVDRDGNVKP